MLIVRAEDASAVIETMKRDPWYTHGIVQLQRMQRWEILIDTRE